MKTTIWIPLALAGALGYLLSGDAPTAKVCYTSVTVDAAMSSANVITVSVLGGTTTLCTGLEAGNVCNIPVQSGSTLGVTFDTNRNQFVYVKAIGTNTASTITSTQAVTDALDFAVVGVQGGVLAVEGDPKIQLVPTSCS